MWRSMESPGTLTELACCLLCDVLRLGEVAASPSALPFGVAIAAAVAAFMPGAGRWCCYYRRAF